MNSRFAQKFSPDERFLKMVSKSQSKWAGIFALDTA